jgi:tagatose-1,6-bisphosphate aldolase
MTKLTAGKLAGLKAVSDARGVIAAAAMDQRGSLKKSLAKEKGVSDLPDSALEEFKELVTDVLTQYASAILLDPEYGLPASKRRHGKGLLLAYEKTGFLTCSITGRYAGSKRRVRTASRCCSTTRRLKKATSTIASTPSSSA